MIQVFGPKKFKEMTEFYEDYYTKKSKVEVSNSVKNITQIAKDDINKEVSDLLDELATFVCMYMREIPAKQQPHFLATCFPSHKETITKFYRHFVKEFEKTPPKKDT